MQKSEQEQNELANKQLELNAEVSKAQIALYKAISDSIKEISTSFIDKKFSHNKSGIITFGLIVFSILVAIIILAMCDKITADVTGTLIASIIGYAIGKFSNVKDGNKGE